MITTPSNPTSPAQAEEHVSAEALAHLLELDSDGAPEIFRELITLFNDSIPQLLTQACGALDQPLQLALIAHSIKGSCSNFGAHRMEALSSELEQLGRQKTAKGAREMIDAIEQEYLKVRAALERALDESEAKKKRGGITC